MNNGEINKGIQGIDLFLLVKYISRATDQDENSHVEKWISESDQNKSEFIKLSKAWALASAAAGFDKWNTEKRKEEFLKRIIEIRNDERRITGANDTGKFKLIRMAIRYAAAIVLILGISGIITLSLNRRSNDEAFTDISASRGSKTEMTLSDGSKVLLNGGSTIRYGNGYDKNNRDLYLTGEGYFEVAKNHRIPFRVHAGEVVVQATGTVFNIKAYPDENVIETTLVEGSVTVVAESNPENKILLAPNEQVNYYTASSETRMAKNFLIIKGINPQNNTSWINDELIISNETLGSLAIKLGRKYDVDIHFDDNSLQELRYTGVLKNETIEQILDILKISSAIDYRMEKREIWLFHDRNTKIISGK
jgi:transmembrane sensor